MLIVKVVEALFKFLISVYQLTEIASLEKSIDICEKILTSIIKKAKKIFAKT